MALKIGEKLEKVRKYIEDGDAVLANDLAKAAEDAIFAGIGRFNQDRVVVEGTKEWERLMKFFTDDPKELARLCGKDRGFNGSSWGLRCLAYIAGDGGCTSMTARAGGTMRTINVQQDSVAMLTNLDYEP